LVAFDLHHVSVCIAVEIAAHATTHSSFMFAQRSMNDTHIEEDLAGVANLVEFGECIVKLIVVVASKGCDPSLDFLPSQSALPCVYLRAVHPRQKHTCFNDMAAA
jgi:hypothetical protein